MTLAEKKFEVVKEQGVALTTRCLAIKITDAGTLAMAQQVVSQTKEFEKAVEAKRAEIKKPYLDAGKEIDSIAKSINDPVRKGLNFAEEQLRAWNEAEKKRVANANAANQKLADHLQKVQDAINIKLATCITPDDCDKLIASIKANFPNPASYGIYEEQAHKVKENYIQLLEVRKATVKAATGNSATAATEVAKSIETAAIVQEQIVQNKQEIEETKQIVQENNVAITSKVRKTWKFEVADEAKLPRQFLSADDAKIRAYLTANEAKIKADDTDKIIGGVRFYLDEKPM